jgi:hypothetical protein
LAVVLYDRDTFSLTLSEEHKFEVSENKILKEIFTADKDGGGGDLYQITLYYRATELQQNTMGWTCSSDKVDKQSIQNFYENTFGHAEDTEV